MDAAGELLVVGALWALYRGGRLLVAGHEGLARDHAALVRDIEGALGLPSEAAIQGLFASEPVLRAANVYYTSVHFPLTIAFLVWGYLCRPRREYRWARNLLLLQTAGALAIHILYPLAPPRMFAEWGFVDTMAQYGPSPYDGASADVANQFAAMPSLHVGWAVLIAFVVRRTGPRPLAVAATAHALVTVVVVVITGNHWWIDGIVAVVLLALAAQLLKDSAPPTRRPERTVGVDRGSK